MITVCKKEVSRTGKVNYGWMLGRGYVSGKETVKTKVWCVVRNGKVIAECRSYLIAQEIASSLRF